MHALIREPNFSYHRFTTVIAVKPSGCDRMVFSSDTGWAGAVIAQYDSGLTSSIQNIDIFAQKLTSAVEHSVQFVPGESAQNFARYNFERNVQQHWTALLKSRLGLKAELLTLDLPKHK